MFVLLCMEQVVVKAVPLKNVQTTLKQWLSLLLTMNTFLVMYLLWESDMTGYVLAYIFWGVWLPCLGFIAMDAGEMKSLMYFALVQCVLSSMIFCSVLSVLFFYDTYRDMCEDCAQQFAQDDDLCFLQTMNMTMTLSVDDCVSVPQPDEFYTFCATIALICVVGMCTSYEAQTLAQYKKAKVVTLEEVSRYVMV